jgi:hypothetical protein
MALSLGMGMGLAALSKGGGAPAGFAWLSDFEGNPVFDFEGGRLYGAVVQ